MKKIISKIFLLLIPLLAANSIVIAQNDNDPASKFRIATSEERKLHDDAYTTLQQEIEAKLCNKDWGISEPVFLISDHPDEMIVIKDDTTEYNIPDFVRENETFKIRLKSTSPLFKVYQDSIHKFDGQQGLDKLKEGFKLVEIYGNKMEFANIGLSLNETYTDELEGKILPKIPGIQQAALYKQRPDDYVTVYIARLYIGYWPKLSPGKMMNYQFKKHSGQPVIENMKITISTFDYNQMMKVLHSIDWTKLEKLVKSS